MGERKLKVKWAVEGRPVPMIGPRIVRDGIDVNVIRDEVVEVEDLRYYRQRILKGDLVEVTTTTTAPQNFGEELLDEDVSNGGKE